MQTVKDIRRLKYVVMELCSLSKKAFSVEDFVDLNRRIRLVEDTVMSEFGISPKKYDEMSPKKKLGPKARREIRAVETFIKKHPAWYECSKNSQQP